MAYVDLERSAERQPVTFERALEAAKNAGQTALHFLGRITPFSGNLPERPLASHGDWAEMHQRVQQLPEAGPTGWQDGHFVRRPRYTDHWALRGSHPTWPGFPDNKQ